MDDPDELQKLLGTSAECECGRRHEVPTRRALIGRRVLESLPALLDEFGLGGPALVVSDVTTREVAGRCVEGLLDGAGVTVEALVLKPQTSHRLEATAEVAARVEARLREGYRVAIAVGSGTINDLTKLPASNAGVPYIAVATAPSMNGYPSAIAAILEGGIKRTVSCAPPIAVVADTDILVAAPREMIAAGLGDLLSKATSSADWKMASLVREEYYCDRPIHVVEEAERRCRAAAEAIGRGEAGAIETLAVGLIRSGVSMAMAGSSAPASGGEHLMSHYWDMTAAARGRQPRLHGEQVGVATLVCAALYERLRDWQPSAADVQRALRCRPDAATVARASRDHFAPLLGEQVAEGIVAELRAKHAAREHIERPLLRLAEAPEQFWAELTPTLRPVNELRDTLREAGAPTTIRELGVSRDELRAAFIHGRDIRGRYTILDLAFDLGVLHDGCDEVLEASGV